RGEVFTFATRLTRLSRDLRRLPPAVALERIGRLAPDWSGGTRIGQCLGEFVATHGARGMARGAVVVIVSDGWDTGDPALLGEQMRRLSRLAYRSGERRGGQEGGTRGAAQARDRMQSVRDRDLRG